MIEIAGEQKKDLQLEVNQINQVARNLYDKYGFKQVGRRKNYYANGEDAILMTKKYTKNSLA